MLCFKHACLRMPSKKGAVVIVTTISVALSKAMFFLQCSCGSALHVVWKNRTALLESELSQYKGKCVVYNNPYSLWSYG